MIVDVSNYLIDALNVIVVSNVFHIELLIYEGKGKAVLQKRLFLSCLFSKLPIKNPCVVYIPHREFIFVATEAYYGNSGPFQPLVTKTY